MGKITVDLSKASDEFCNGFLTALNIAKGPTGYRLAYVAGIVVTLEDPDEEDKDYCITPEGSARLYR